MFETQTHQNAMNKVQLTQVESHVGILDFLFQILKEHVKKPRNPEF